METPQPTMLRVGFDSPSHPFAYLDQGQPSGLLVEVATAVLADMGATPEWVPLEPDESEIALMERRVDLLAFKVVVAARGAVFAFTSPILTTGAGLFVSPESTIASTQDIGRFGGRPIATPRRGSLSAMLTRRYPGLRQLLTGSPEEALEAVAGGKADAAVLDMETGAYWIGERFRGKVLMPTAPFLAFELAMATSRRRTDQLIERLEAALGGLRARGRLDSLVRERQH
jgi:ABC-type amino acid transport substrate-binding protein